MKLTGLTANSLYHFRVRSRDAGGILGISSDFTFTSAVAPPSPDTIPPQISRVRSVFINSTVTITWLTNENSNSQVEYGPTTDYGLTTPLDTRLLTNHQAMLTNLVPNTRYHYRVRSRDAAGNLAVSGDFIVSRRWSSVSFGSNRDQKRTVVMTGGN
jgi:phosphodiesterase/alkaline phosphatase D-like protein